MDRALLRLYQMRGQLTPPPTPPLKGRGERQRPVGAVGRLTGGAVPGGWRVVLLQSPTGRASRPRADARGSHDRTGIHRVTAAFDAGADPRGPPGAGPEPAR